MARAGQNKRKEPEHDENQKSAFAEAVRLEMLSDEEEDEEADEFPEIDNRSDGDSDDESDSDEEVDEQGSPSDPESDSSSDVHIFPKSKDVISEITGHPKRVYPEIEPEYDSDSSTEDVRVPFPIILG